MKIRKRGKPYGVLFVERKPVSHSHPTREEARAGAREQRTDVVLPRTAFEKWPPVRRDYPEPSEAMNEANRMAEWIAKK